MLASVTQPTHSKTSPRRRRGRSAEGEAAEGDEAAAGEAAADGDAAGDGGEPGTTEG